MSTTTAKTWNCSIESNKGVLTIVSPGGSKRCPINTNLARKAGINMGEIDLLSKIRAAAGTTIPLTMEEMTILSSIRKRCETLQSAPVEATSNGTAAATESGLEIREISKNRNINMDTAERRVKSIQNTLDTLNDKIFMLIYDIPTAKNEDCPNPSTLLWNYGFRLNLSCWVLPEKGLNAVHVKRLLSHWQEHNIETHIIRYADDQVSKIREIARDKLCQEVRRIHTSFIERLGAACERLETARKELDNKTEAGEPVSAIDYEKAEAYRDNTIRGIIKKAGESLEAAINCARAFDELENFSDLFQGVREVVRAEQATYNAQMLQKGSKPSNVII